jgi:ATP-dependent Clp protease ATP-binding subunit ClpA
LLGILDKATLTLGDNRRVDFSRAMIFMTSNLGAPKRPISETVSEQQ